ncbi:MAG: lipoprotein-releasing ABC transporter permease subunit [Rickettsiaceae bacterium]|nr:lipoprotein-releasing ABC transporter permease subunit [Rickettsiaceae bacterium]
MNDIKEFTLNESKFEFNKQTADDPAPLSLKFCVIIALRYFSAKKTNKLVSFISIFSLLGVMLGVAALIVVMAVMEGFHIEFTSNMIGLGGDITITRPKGLFIADHKDLSEKIKTLPGITAAIPQVQEKALIVSKSNSNGAIVRGLRDVDIKNKPAISDNQVAGSLMDIYEKNGAAIGKELAINLGLRVGDEFAILVPNNVSTIIGNLPRKKTLRVSCIFSSSMYDYDSSTIIISLENAQKIFSLDNLVNIIEIHTQDADNAETFAKNISEYLMDNLGDSYYVSTWMDANQQFLNALKIERVTMYTILSLIIIVAAFNIISSLFMLVHEKKKDIAILKTIGASKRQILTIFVINGSLIGLIGTFLGVVFGILFANNIDNIRILLENLGDISIFNSAIYMLYHLPSKIVVSNIISVSAMSLCLCVVATIYPALKAATIDPADAIRND